MKLIPAVNVAAKSCQSENLVAKEVRKPVSRGNVKHQASDGQLQRVGLTANFSLAILEEDQRPPSVRKGGTVCISKSKEWNGLAPSPKRATYPASLMRLKRGALPEPEPLSRLRTGLLVFTDDLLIDGNNVPPFAFFTVFEEASSRGEQRWGSDIEWAD